MMEFKMMVLERGVPILEELNKTPGMYVNFNTLRDNVSINPPTLIVGLHELVVCGYIDKKLEEPKKDEDIANYKILEKGQKALKKYKESRTIIDQIP